MACHPSIYGSSACLGSRRHGLTPGCPESVKQSTGKYASQCYQEIKITRAQTGNCGAWAYAANAPAKPKNAPTEPAAAIQLKWTLLERSTQQGFVKNTWQQLINKEIDSNGTEQNKQQTQIVETQKVKHRLWPDHGRDSQAKTEQQASHQSADRIEKCRTLGHHL